MDVPGFNAGIGHGNGFDHKVPGGKIIDQQRLVCSSFHNRLGQNQCADIAFVLVGNGQRLIKKVENGQGTGWVSFGEPGGVFKGVNGRAPNGNIFDGNGPSEVFPLIGRVIDQF